MKNKSILVICTVMISVLFAGAHSFGNEVLAKDLTYYTEEYPPHNYTENGKLKGAAVEVLVMMWKEMGLKNTVADIKTVPWARGMKLIQTEPGVVLFGMGYSKERAKIIQWVGPYYTHTLGLIAKKSRAIKIRTVEEAQEYIVGAVREDMGHQFLVGKGFHPGMVALLNSQRSLFLSLDAGRLDLASSMDSVAFKNIDDLGLDSSEYEIVLNIQTFQSGFGFSKRVDKSVILQFQNTLDRLIEDGSVGKILEKYDIN